MIAGMTKFVLPSDDKLPELIVLSSEIKRGLDLPDDIEQRIMKLLDVEDAAWNGLIGAFALRDIVFAGSEYVNIDIREYYKGTEKEYFLIKIEHDHGETQGDHHTREGAMLDALISHIVSEMEWRDE